MEFEPTSFIIGAAAGASGAWLLGRSRRRLRRARDSADARLDSGRRFAAGVADRRYARVFTAYLQRRHLAGDHMALTDILLEPRLIPAASPVLAPADTQDDTRDIFEVIPIYHDMPYSYAPYNLATVALDELGAGHRQVAILGVSGMGRSTALTTLALMALGQVSFEKLEDLSEQAIREEEAALSDEDRAARREERQRIEARALERLRSAQEQRARLVTGEQGAGQAALDIRRLAPILVDLRDIAFDEETRALDPSEPLIRAAQHHLSPVAARVLGSLIYPALEKGQALVLLDGYDDLAPDARPAYFHWLRQLVALYGHNLMVIAGPVAGHEPLIALGFAPTFLRAWRPDDYDLLARRWAAVWGGRKRRDEEPDEQVMRRITADNHARSMLDVTLKIWAGLADDTQEMGRSGWYGAYVSRRLSDPALREVSGALGSVLTAVGQPLARGVIASALASEAGGPELPKAVRYDGLVDTLVKDGLLRAFHGDRFVPVHPLIGSFLASEAVARAGTERATELALEPVWQDALAFAAARINLMPVVYRKLGGAPDLLLTDLFDVVRWLPEAPSDALWRGDLFKRLAAALLATDQYPEVRARAMAALIASRDKNVIFILRQGLHAQDGDIRRLACIGLGALATPDAIGDLAPLLQDEEQTVRLAAALALGAIGGEKAMQHMIRSLFEADHDARRAIAEALAAIPGEGHTLLREAIVAQEIEIRRAAVYGLARIRATWALVALYRTMLEDEQWYVRTAAEEAFLAAQSPDRAGPALHPEADSLAWLIQWAAEQGEGVPAGPNARQVLVRALQEGQPSYQIMAAHTLARLGHVAALKPLYAALRDREPSVRGAAYEALAALQVRLGTPLPGVL